MIGTPEQREIVKGDQLASKKCFVNAVRTKGKPKEVQNIEVSILKCNDLGKIKDEWKGPDEIGMPIIGLLKNSSRFPSPKITLGTF